MGLRGPRALLRLTASWILWWVILATWKIGPAVPAILRMSRDGGHGTANVGYSDGALRATITEAGTVTWEGHASLLKLVLLICLPPLVLWALWLRAERRPDDPGLITGGMPENALVNDAERANEPRGKSR